MKVHRGRKWDVVARGWGRWNRTFLFTGDREDEKVLELDGGDGCTAM